MFTTRPEIQGTFGCVATTHWLGSAAGMAMLEKGGNAFDAAVAAGFVLQVVEPHLVGPAGDVPIIFHSAKTGETSVLCGQGPAPAGATIEHYRAQGIDVIPGNGLLATVVPGAFDAWLTLLRDHGELELSTVLEPAIGYALNGHPIVPGAVEAIRKARGMFEAEWKTSAPIYLPGGAVPEPRSLFRNEPLARMWQRVLAEAASAATREGRIEAARNCFRQGFVAEAIDRFFRDAEAMDQTGRRHKGVLSGQDLATWQASYEAPLTYDYLNHTVCKTGPWGQGPMFLQSLAILRGIDLSAMDPCGGDFVHVVNETLKLAFADREVYYGDPNFVSVPIETLLSDAYASARRAQIGRTASLDLLPGRIAGYEDQVERGLALLAGFNERNLGDESNEPTLAEMLSAPKGDTTHIDVVDSKGNMIAAMPSGGWLQSSPTIPELGFALNSRAQMFVLEPGLPTSLLPGKRPRTTLTPSFVLRDGRPYMAFGSPGGDQQEQWALITFLRHVHYGLNLQEAIELPMFHTRHVPSSFYPRTSAPGHLLCEESFGPAVLDDLRARGHEVEVAPEWTVGRMVAVSNAGDGILRAAATPRLMQAYAVGR
ncbi:MAG: gamma-glutamyltransferase family protein [Nitratireductor sp.]|nr:gamma-glutamyltransferase family protein [Nitratireductor sp.]